MEHDLAVEPGPADGRSRLVPGTFEACRCGSRHYLKDILTLTCSNTCRFLVVCGKLMCWTSKQHYELHASTSWEGTSVWLVR